ncbi:MAG TPA: HEAT repeat domain-containing protein [Candidatus Paceibacterota bacterium]|nr:HEAT repeat domain-containing protein [Verrucomicrobiota bacterium]HSA12103.1 HEAT repeat domain-containing protein [Candidatus Paceibacterota bacterium]
MSKRRKLVLWTLVPIGIAGFAVCTWWTNQEPVYQGKPISYWLDSAQRGILAPSVLGQRETPPNPVFEAKEAVAAMGPKALPYIAAWGTGEAALPWNRLYSQVYRRLPTAISQHLPQPKARRGMGLILTSGYFLAVTERAGTNAAPALVRLYSSSSPEVRRAVILSLGRLAPLDHATTRPVFERALRDAERSVKFDAFRQLCQMARTDPRARASLASYLNAAGTNAPDWLRVEGMAATAVGTGKPPAGEGRVRVSARNAWEQAFAAVADWQHSPTSDARQQVLAAFEAAFGVDPGQSVGSLRRALENLHLTAQQEQELLVPVLVEGLCARNAAVRRDSAEMLRALGPIARSAAPLILRAFEKCPSGEFFLLLADVGPEAAPAVSALVRELASAHDEPSVWEITYALGKVGPGARGAVSALLTMARTNQADIRSYALSALAQIEPQNPETVPLLLAALRSEDSDDRVRAAVILGEMGGWASNAVPALKQVVLEDEWLEPRLDAAKALCRIDVKHGAELVPVFIEALTWPEADGYPTAAIVARLLGQTGQAAVPAVPELVKLFNHEDERARIAAAEALAAIDPSRTSECVAVLRDVMARGRTGLMRFYGAKALLRLAPDASADVVAATASLLKPSVDFYRQEEAIQFLGEIGRPARPALPQLREALESRDWKLRRAARDAIERIESSAPGKPPGDH